MAPLLLDTHAYVWAVSQPDRLSDHARDAIEDPTTSVLVSAATVWEMAIKHHVGKWPEAEPLLTNHEAIMARLGAGPLAISHADARRAGGLRWAHTDPFDRMLASQAVSAGAMLVTRDRLFQEVVGLDLLW